MALGTRGVLKNLKPQNLVPHHLNAKNDERRKKGKKPTGWGGPIHSDATWEPGISTVTSQKTKANGGRVAIKMLMIRDEVRSNKKGWGNRGEEPTKVCRSQGK